MTKRYGVFDPMMGQHVMVDSLTQAQSELQRFAERLVRGMVWSVSEVQVDEAGAETWEPIDTTGWVVVTVDQIPDPPLNRPTLTAGAA